MDADDVISSILVHQDGGFACNDRIEANAVLKGDIERDEWR